MRLSDFPPEVMVWVCDLALEDPSRLELIYHDALGDLDMICQQDGHRIDDIQSVHISHIHQGFPQTRTLDDPPHWHMTELGMQEHWVEVDEAVAPAYRDAFGENRSASLPGFLTNDLLGDGRSPGVPVEPITRHDLRPLVQIDPRASASGLRAEQTHGLDNATLQQMVEQLGPFDVPAEDGS
ncbi:MAG: hypothetical protein AAF415_11685 [Pseudomonadota bacterium]